MSAKLLSGDHVIDHTHLLQPFGGLAEGRIDLMKLKWSNVPIPITHILGIALGGVLQLIFPWTIFQNQLIGYVLGIPVVGAGMGLAGWSVLEAGSTNVESPEKLITSGPYSFSRNPMYVGWGMIYLGVALLVNSVWIMALFPLVIAAIHYLDVLKEEKFLIERFGEEYLDYQSRVRRYL